MPSTVIRTMTYDEETNTLRIEFVSGMIYDHKHVPPETYQSMKNSGSKGIYFNQYIKGNYEFEKVN